MDRIYASCRRCVRIRFLCGTRRCSLLAELATAAVVTVTATLAHATTVCTDICPGTGACSFNDVRTVDPGSVLDCSNRNITIGALGNLKVTNGGFKLIAHNLTVDGTSAASGTITAVEGVGGSPGSLDIKLSGTLYLAGKLRANGTTRGGTIHVDTVGNITIPEVGTDGIEALGTSLTAHGGKIFIKTDGALVVNDPILADGGGGATVSGGMIEIRAGGNITTATDGHISAYGRGGGGGNISIFSYGNITLNEHLKAEGLGDGSDGGSIVVRADNLLTIGNEISVKGAVNSTATAEAAGGSVELSAGCGGVAVNAAVRAIGGQASDGANGGIVDITSSGPVTVSAGVTVDAHSASSIGDGGSIDISSEGLVTIANTAVLDARGGTTSPAGGGDIRIQACRVNIVSGAALKATAFYGGSIQVGATKLPPTTGAQPLVVGSGAQLLAAGSVDGDPGSIRVSPLVAKKGTCSNGPACDLNGDCTVGCETGTCSNANPDTSGVATQFDVAADRESDPSLPSCSLACP